MEVSKRKSPKVPDVSPENNLRTKILFAAAQAGDESQSGSLTAFERLCDNTLTAYFAKAKSVVFGEQVVIAYLCALENEISAARMIISGLQAGLPADTIRARLRDLYQ